MEMFGSSKFLFILAAQDFFAVDMQFPYIILFFLFFEGSPFKKMQI